MSTEFCLDDWGLYVHIPFCQARCTYCDFNTVTHMGPDQHPQYMQAVTQQWMQATLPKGRLVSIFFGGGTPSLVDPPLIEKFLASVISRVGSLDGLEITLESNPGTVDLDRLAAFKEAGVNRLSIGAQAMQDHHLKALNRIHGVDDIYRAVDWAKSAGIENFNLDAIYGLPGHTLTQWQETLRALVSLQPDHLSLYRLQVEAGTPLADGVKRGALVLPEEDNVADMADWAAAVLTPQGYQQYEISNWAQPGRESLHNQLYWTFNSYVGLGAGAHSFHANRRWWTLRGVRRYMLAQAAGDSVIEGEETLSFDEQMREYMWLGLRRRSGVAKQRFQERFDRLSDEVFAKTLENLQGLGLIVNDARTVRLSERGWDVANYVFRYFVADGIS